MPTFMVTRLDDPGITDLLKSPSSIDLLHRLATHPRYEDAFAYNVRVKQIKQIHTTKYGRA